MTALPIKRRVILLSAAALVVLAIILTAWGARRADPLAGVWVLSESSRLASATIKFQADGTWKLDCDDVWYGGVQQMAGTWKRCPGETFEVKTIGDGYAFSDLAGLSEVESEKKFASANGSFICSYEFPPEVIQKALESGIIKRGAETEAMLIYEVWRKDDPDMIRVLLTEGKAYFSEGRLNGLVVARAKSIWIEQRWNDLLSWVESLGNKP